MQARKSTISSPCNYIQARLAAKTIFETGWTFEQHERDPSSRKGEGIVVFFCGLVWAGCWRLVDWNLKRRRRLCPRSPEGMAEVHHSGSRAQLGAPSFCRESHMELLYKWFSYVFFCGLETSPSLRPNLFAGRFCSSYWRGSQSRLRFQSPRIVMGIGSSNNRLLSDSDSESGSSNNGSALDRFRKCLNFNFAAYSLIALLSVDLCYHILILTRVVPYKYVWGGRLKSEASMIRFETVSFSLNLSFIVLVVLRAQLCQTSGPQCCLKVLCWICYLIFTLNTVGNILASSWFEMLTFTPVTLYAALAFARLALGEDDEMWGWTNHHLPPGGSRGNSCLQSRPPGEVNEMSLYRNYVWKSRNKWSAFNLSSNGNTVGISLQSNGSCSDLIASTCLDTETSRFDMMAFSIWLHVFQGGYAPYWGQGWNMTSSYHCPCEMLLMWQIQTRNARRTHDLLNVSIMRNREELPISLRVCRILANYLCHTQELRVIQSFQLSNKTFWLPSRSWWCSCLQTLWGFGVVHNPSPYDLLPSTPFLLDDAAQVGVIPPKWFVTWPCCLTKSVLWPPHKLSAKACAVQMYG